MADEPFRVQAPASSGILYLYDLHTCGNDLLGDDYGMETALASSTKDFSASASSD